MHRVTLKQVVSSAAALTLIAGAAAFRPSPEVVSSKMMADSTDQEVVAFLITANQEEIRQARAALATTQDADVKRFAQRMVSDHGQGLTKIRAIGKRLGYATADSMPARPDMSVPSTDSAAAPVNPNAPDQPYPRTGDSVGVNVPGHGTDGAYIDGQVAAHQRVLEKLDSATPGLKDNELKKYVGEVQKAVQSHLTEAKRIQTRLEKTS